MPEIKKRPILFSAPMVRAILDGRKTVTRRVVKTQPRDDATIEVDLYNPVVVDRHGVEQPGPEIFGAFSDDGEWGSKFPYGRPGDRLWVRETTAEDCRGSISTATYTADGAPSALEWWYSRRSCPSIHMPRVACRILLEITDVRVERLQDISNEQAEAEGIDYLREAPDLDETLTAAQLFDCLWSSINGEASWAANPWVWVIEFKQVTP